MSPAKAIAATSAGRCWQEAKRSCQQLFGSCGTQNAIT